jgi:hypothetical protein
MRSLLLLFFLFPFKCLAQNGERDAQRAEKNKVIYRTPWKSLVRPTVRNPLNCFYRFQDSLGHFSLELKISSGGLPFIVTQHSKLELELENGDVLQLFTGPWMHSCKGCGSLSKNADIPGVALSFPITRNDIDALYDSYLGHIRLYLTDYVLGSLLTLRRTETFREQVEVFKYAIENGRN